MIKNKKIHFIGICGAGASAVAVMLKDEGNIVTGSDQGFYEPTASFLKKNGIAIQTPYKEENIPKDADIIVIGRHSKLDKKENEEVKEALKTPEKIKSFPEILRELTEGRENIVVAGSSGKSTCAALLAWCLKESGRDIGYFFGAVPTGWTENAKMGTDKIFVLEGDEYPDYKNKPKFLYFHPASVLMTSIEHDHVNIFPTFESYVQPFREFVEKIHAGELLVLNSKIKEVNAKAVTYGMGKDAPWHAENIKYGKTTSFDLYKNSKKIIDFSTTLLGKHNIENIVGVSALILEKNLITPLQLQKAVATFKGLKRRLDLKTDKSSVLIYEGFGSSYSKAKTAIEAMKLHFPDKKLIIIFEPHTFSWRNRDNLRWYDDIFAAADEVLIFAPPEHGKDTHNQAGADEIVARVKKTKKNAQSIESKEVAQVILEKITQPDDMILLLTSGDLGGLIETLPAWAEQRFPK